jgi:ribonuclease BN (tRNA processing enzyme)
MMMENEIIHNIDNDINININANTLQFQGKNRNDDNIMSSESSTNLVAFNEDFTNVSCTEQKISPNVIGKNKKNWNGQKKNSKLKTWYDTYKENLITIGDYSGFASIAARHTAIEYGSIQLDVGHVPPDVGMNKLLVLITHFHADHGRDIMNCIGHGERVTIFVPAYCAQTLFTKIKCDMSMQKGRPYIDEEIIAMVRIIGCKRDNGEFKDQNKVFSSDNPELIISEFVNMGDLTRIQLRGREEVMIEPFACYHTVDTCGYMIYEIRKRLADEITFAENSFIDNNFTEDQTTNNHKYKKKKDKKKEQEDEKNNMTIINDTNANNNTNNNDNTNDSDNANDIMNNENIIEKRKVAEEYNWKTDEKYDDVIGFMECNNVMITPEILDKIMTPNFTLKVRRLHFPNGLKIKTKDDDNNCVLSSTDFAFFKKYKISVTSDYLISKTMFFGDTGSYVFDERSIGYKRVSELLGSAETVIIESTFLENRSEMSDKKYKKRFEKRHMFLFELCEIFKMYPQTKFLLIHFSACYNKATIKRYINEINKTYKNVSAFI